MIPSDYLFERKILTRRLSFWRRFAFATVVITALGLGYRALGARPTDLHIARVAIDGMIIGDQATQNLLRSVADSNAGAVILSINSPGGTTTGSEILYDSIRKLAEKKPVVAVVNNAAASGAYIAAIGADYIVARGNSIVGSIGVLMQAPNVSKLLETIGVKVEEVKSSPLKASPSGVTPTPPEAIKAIEGMILDSYSWFKELVRTRRNLSDAELAVVSDGRVFTGRQGLNVKLVDRIGGETEAVAWLEAEKGVAKKLPIRDWSKTTAFENLGFTSMLKWGFKLSAQSLGVPEFSHWLDAMDQNIEAGRSDGLLSVWRPSTTP